MLIIEKKNFHRKLFLLLTISFNFLPKNTKILLHKGKIMHKNL
jgi:hypothetical protein